MNPPEDADVLKDASSFVRQGVLTKKDVFKWNVQASLVQKGEARSDMFTFGPAKNSKFCLMLGMDPEKSEYLHNQFGICLYRKHPSNAAEDVAIKVQIALLDTRDRLHYPCEKVMRDSDRVYATFDCSVFDKHQHLFFRKDKLCIHCSLDVEEVLSEDIKDLSSKGMSYDPRDGSMELVENLKSLMETERFCDIVLCTNGKEFRAHKSIVGARSPVFAAMFEHETLEKMENRVNIDDIDSEVMYHFLRYMYTGGTENVSPGVSLSLLAAADKYSLPKLKKMCSHYLCSNLTVDMSLSVLVIANLHEDENVKEAAIRMILDNAVQVMKTDDWLTFLKDYPELANTVILRLATQK